MISIQVFPLGVQFQFMNALSCVMSLHLKYHTEILFGKLLIPSVAYLSMFPTEVTWVCYKRLPCIIKQE